jgi:hypothetical protein
MGLLSSLAPDLQVVVMFVILKLPGLQTLYMYPSRGNTPLRLVKT